MQTAYTILILLTLVGVSRLIARMLPLPLPLVQIGMGAMLAWPTLGLHVALDPQLFLFMFLPPLLFSDGWRVPKRDLWRYRAPIFLLAVGLVLFTVIIAGFFIHWILPSIPLPVAFALAAVISPTDAVAVIAIAQNRLPAPVMRVLQGEALTNDASGLVTFNFAIAASITGVFSLPTATATFVFVACGGLCVGVALSWVVGRFRGWMVERGWDDPATHVVFMLLLPFAAYVLAERLEVSGILSAVAAGMMQSWVDLLPRQTSTRLLNRSVWTLLEFAFNGLIFLLMGLQLPDIVIALAHDDQAQWSALPLRCLDVLWIFAVLLLLRYVWTQGTCLVLSGIHAWRKSEDHSDLISRHRSSLLLTFGGVRGSVTLAGILSVPLFIAQGVEFPERNLLIFISAGVILLSLVSATVMLPLLLRGINAVPDQQIRREIDDAWRRTALAAIRSMEHVDDPAVQNPSDAAELVLIVQAKSRVMSEYEHRLEIYNGSAEAQALAFHVEVVERRMRINALKAQRLELYRLHKDHEIADDVLSHVLAELDLNEANLGRP
jgi:CPA1 family monovalent cation:H+ antiporter